jgi:ribosome-associated protein
MEIFNLENHLYVELCDLLKFQGWCESGGTAKEVIAEGLVKVNGQVETRKRCKIVDGQKVSYKSMNVTVKT